MAPTVTLTSSKPKFRKERARWRLLKVAVSLPVILITARLWQLQVVGYEVYAGLASGQREVVRQLVPERGEVFAGERDGLGGRQDVPLAVNRLSYHIYAEPVNIEDQKGTAGILSPILGKSVEEIEAALDKPGDPYEPLAHRVEKGIAMDIKDLNIPGIKQREETIRFYPGNNISSHLLGFVAYRDNQLIGQYGVEGFLNDILSGTPGSFRSERNAAGVWIALAERDFTPAIDGSDVILTIDWTIQFRACRSLNDWVKRYSADGGSLIVINPKTGAILALCGSPDFNPNVYNEVDKISSFNNPSIFLAYEPGSIMKPITMAAALDRGAVEPSTTYVDTGAVTFGPYTIKNSDNKAHGKRTMTDVLVRSLNTGAIFAMRSVGPSIFRSYVEDFGFGTMTGIELSGEASGDISRLYEENEIYAATGSFGQGLTVTPIQMVAAYAAIANGGKLMQPYVVKEIRHPDGMVEVTTPRIVRQVISEKTAAVLSGMLVSVIEDGHGKHAGVPGYFMAGKTGTAQIPRKDGQGYEENATIGSFVGFGPISDPRFAMIVRIDRPRSVRFAESSAAPLFGDVARFILQYYEVPPDRK